MHFNALEIYEEVLRNSPYKTNILNVFKSYFGTKSHKDSFIDSCARERAWCQSLRELRSRHFTPFRMTHSCEVISLISTHR